MKKITGPEDKYAKKRSKGLKIKILRLKIVDLKNKWINILANSKPELTLEKYLDPLLLAKIKSLYSSQQIFWNTITKARE